MSNITEAGKVKNWDNISIFKFSINIPYDAVRGHYLQMDATIEFLVKFYPILM